MIQAAIVLVAVSLAGSSVTLFALGLVGIVRRLQ